MSSDAARCPMPHCEQDAWVLVRMIPRRTESPLCDDIRRALAWPHVEQVIEIGVCARHRMEVRRAARVIYAETPLTNEVVNRKVMGGDE